MILTPEKLKEIENNAVRISDPVFKKTRHWTIDEIAKGVPFNNKFIKKCLANANKRKWEHREANRGWTRNKYMRSEVRIPTSMYLMPGFKDRYFPEGADAHEANKCLEQLKRDFPAFVTHD